MRYNARMATIRDSLISFAAEQLGCSTDYPFVRYPEYLALRNPLNGKWCGLVMRVPQTCVGIPGDDEVDIVNVKLDPLMIASLKTQPGYAPAWHMNKEHWISVLLDGSVPLDQACALLEMSNAQVAPARRKR